MNKGASHVNGRTNHARNSEAFRTVGREVLDFIGYIEFKHGIKDQLAEELKSAQTPAMNQVWGHPEDEVWNDV